MAAENTGGAIPVNADLKISDAFKDAFKDFNNATSSAGGGRISNGMIFNSAGSSFGLVKTVALAGVLLLALRIFKGRK